MSLSIVGIRERLNELMPFVLVLAPKMSQFSHQYLSIQIGLIFALADEMKIGCQLFRAEESAYFQEEIPDKLWSVIIQQVNG